VATPSDAEALASLYGEVFASYPFPIHDQRFVRESMADGTTYLLIREEATGRVVAAASAEPSCHPRTCEMTDFATVPEKRGLGLAGVLLYELERHATADGMRTAYTIARATSVGMNRVFARQGYTHAGTLVNNTNIAGRIESMHVWYRALV
jgi:putative beta-lysine N-acetyltransferase